MPTLDPGQALRERVLAYFAANPDETLTASDISRKFSVGIRLVPEALIPAVAGDQLRLNSHGDYSAGAKLQAQAAPATTTPKPVKRAVVLPPAESISIDSGIPMPSKARPHGRRSAFAAVFERMQAGDSFAVSSEAGRRVFNLATGWGKSRKAKFALRTVDGQARIWRTE